MTFASQTETIYGIYVIESLRERDFKDGRYLSQILKMSKIQSKYKWARNKRHFQSILKDFVNSRFRYLHLSCHADEAGIEIDGEEISNEELQSYLNNHLQNRRIFMSTCRGANRDLAERLICKCGAISLIGTPIDLYFHKSALFWPSFYYTMNELDEHKMKREHLKKSLQIYVDLFKVSINYYVCVDDNSKHIRRLRVRPNEPISNHLLNVKI